MQALGDPGSYIGVSKNKGSPKWMVYKGKPYLKWWFGCTTIFGNTHIPLDPKTMKNAGFKPPKWVITPKNEGFEFPW